MQSRIEATGRLGRFLLVSLTVASSGVLVLSSTGCELPVLVRAEDVWERYHYDIQKRDLSREALDKKMRLIDEQYVEPRTPAKVALSLETARAYESPNNGYDSLWRGVRAAVWLARHHPDLERREEYAVLGISMGRAATKVRELSVKVEPHYYLALALGGYCEVIHEAGNIPSVDLLLKARESALLAASIDERFDHAGPLRFVGKLIVETSDTLTHDIGSFDEGLEYLRKAAKISPDFAENHLFLAQALEADEQYVEARQEVDAVIHSAVPPDHSAEHEEWLREAQRVLADLPNGELRETNVEVTSYEES